MKFLTASLKSEYNTVILLGGSAEMNRNCWHMTVLGVA